VSTIEVPVNPPYRKLPDQKLNEFGIPEKPSYRTEDVAKILKITPSALQWRFRMGWYHRHVTQDPAGRRIFTIEDIAKIITTKKYSSVPIAKATEV
jgi:hypothetical protein